jgi:hypothetical protein
MKYDPQKAFPYPVLRPGSDDYTEAEFQTTVQPTIEKEEIRLGVTHDLSSPKIRGELAAERAEYVCIVSCRATYFRDVVRSKEKAYAVTYPAAKFKGEVLVQPFIVVKKPVSSFSCKEWSAEFGDRRYELTPFQPITSVFDLEKNDDLDEGEWTIGFEDEHIHIQVSPEMKQQIDDARNVPTNRVILINGLYFPAVLQTIVKMQQSSSEFESKRWFEVIRMQAQNAGLDFDHADAHILAQRLMRHPLLRMKKLFAEGAGK